MRLKVKHIRHPFRTLTAARKSALAYLSMKRCADRSKIRFRGDQRYDLQNVNKGFAPLVDNHSDDTELLNRICAAYSKTLKDQHSASQVYQPSPWWQRVREKRLVPVMEALQRHDLHALAPMYRNFFRDPCGSGLIAMTHGISGEYRGAPLRDVLRHFYLGDTLSSVDYWTEQTAGRFSVRDLAGPEIGNPFGVMVGSTLVRTGSPYQHYCAHRLCGRLNSASRIVAEIGGGYGGMAYYLLRDRPRLTYIDFDLPETIALASYFLIKAFPALSFSLYGEKDPTREELFGSNVVLMPLFAMEKLPPRSVDVTFSSHAMSDVSHESMADYLKTIARSTKGYFLYVGNADGAKLLSDLARHDDKFQLVETPQCDWHGHRNLKEKEVEMLFRIDSAE